MFSIPRLIAPLAFALSATLTMPQLAPAATGASSPIVISNCGNGTTTPSTIVLACADANRSFMHLQWSHWGARSATASGFVTWNTCTPTCAAGTMKQQRVTITATHLMAAKGYHYYATLTGPAGVFGQAGTSWTLPAVRQLG